MPATNTAMTPGATPAIRSRLPQVGTTIFTVMSALAQDLGAVNLGQGFHRPLLMESNRAQPPFGNLPVASSLRLPHAIQVTWPSRKRTANRAPGCGKYIF